MDEKEDRPGCAASPALFEQIAELRALLLQEAETYRVVLHTLANAMNAMSLKMELILTHLRRRDE